MSKFIAGLLLGLVAAVLTLPALQAFYLGPPAVLWSDYESNITISYFDDMDKCDSVRELNKGALDAACFRAETLTATNPLYIEFKK